ncbi:MAG: hypothetical protein IVW51_05990 [Thermaceae bacterium]|nr:hypothetical protein [Thermaceae bacterium]
MKKAKKLEELRKANRALLEELEEACRAYAVSVSLLKEQRSGKNYHSQLEVLQNAISELRNKAKEADQGLKKEHKLGDKLASTTRR